MRDWPRILELIARLWRALFPPPRQVPAARPPAPPDPTQPKRPLDAPDDPFGGA